MKKNNLLFIDQRFGWRKVKISKYILWIKGTIYNFSDLSILKKLISINERSLKKFFKNLDGHFALIFKKKIISFAQLTKFLLSQFSTIKINEIFLSLRFLNY